MTEKEVDDTLLLNLLVAELNLLEKRLGRLQPGERPTWSSKVFEFHPYCWCGHVECKQCGLDEPNFSADGLDIWWYKHIGRSMDGNLGSLSRQKIIQIFTACHKDIDRTVSREKRCVQPDLPRNGRRRRGKGILQT